MPIIAPVGRSDRSADALREAEALGVAFDDTVHVIHVLTRSEFVELGRTSVKENEPIDIDRVREVAADIASEAAAEIDAPTETVGLMGDPADRIVEYATDQDARYIVLTSRKRSPAGKAIFGSTTQSVLLNSTCPVVTTGSR